MLPDNIRNQRLADAVEKLSLKFGLNTFKSSANAIGTDVNRRRPPGYDSVRAEQQVIDYSDPSSDDLLFGNIIERFINTTAQVDTAANFSKYIFDTLDKGDGNQNDEITKESKTRFANLMTIIADDEYTEKFRIQNGSSKKIYISKAQSNGVPMLPSLIGETWNAHDNPCCDMAIICYHAPQLSLATRNTNACTIFLNGIRSIDMSRAVPYLSVEFQIPLAPTGPAEEGSTEIRLLAPTLYKFILGGTQTTPGSPLSKLVNANLDSPGQPADTSGPNGAEVHPAVPPYTRIGMEVFTSPQTLVNGDEYYDENIRLNGIQDKFRPFMSLKDFSATIGPNGFGSMSYSTAKLSMVCHDKSRLAEIAPFIRADIRGKTHVEVEYGWTHPDGERLIRNDSKRENYFADIINGMRTKERYQIPTSTYSFTDSGEIQIDLNLVTLALLETHYELVGIGESTDDLARLRELQEKIDELIQASHINQILDTGEQTGSNRRPPPIHGAQILQTVANGFQSGFRLNEEERKLFKTFIKASTVGGPLISSLRTLLRRLYGPEGTGNSGEIETVRASINSNTLKTLQNILQFITNNDGKDPFLGPRRANFSPLENTARNLASPERNVSILPTPSQPDLMAKSASLATIMMSFIGVPLAKAGKTNGLWQEVQMVYYTFNTSAGFIGGKNIAGFQIDLSYFYERYNKFRTDNIARSGNINLATLWKFINQDFIDDLAAPSYELWDFEGSFYHIPAPPRPSAGQQAEVVENPNVAVPRYEAYDLNNRMTKVLRTMTSDGEWKPPHLEFSLENLKELHPVDPSKPKTILRIHIYDKAANVSEGLNALIQASQHASMTISGNGSPPDNDSITNYDAQSNPQQYGNNGINTTPTELTAHRALWSATIMKAETAGIVEMIQRGADGQPPNPPRYKIKGGFKALKKFIMSHSPYIIPGAQGSLVKSVSVASMQDPNATLQLMSNPRPSENLYPNGAGDKGVPLQLMPTDVSMDIMGCPLIAFTNSFFIDFNTSTSIDDMWMVSGIDHRLAEGSFTSNIKFKPNSGYGHYTNYLNILNDMQVATTDLLGTDDQYSRDDYAANHPLTSPAPTTHHARPAATTTPPVDNSTVGQNAGVNATDGHLRVAVQQDGNVAVSFTPSPATSVGPAAPMPPVER